MINNQESGQDTKQKYRDKVQEMGKKEFTFQKMQEYGFWPKDLPTPYEKQQNETPEDYKKREELLKSLKSISNQIAVAYKEKDEIMTKLQELRKQYSATFDYEKMKMDVAKQIFKESLERRAKRKEERELKKQAKHEAWIKNKSENIVFIGTPYSSLLYKKDCDKLKLIEQKLPVLKDDKELAELLNITYQQLRFITYHRDVVTEDHYYRYTVPKRNGGERHIAAPKLLMKNAQKKILTEILEKIPVSMEAHGFIKGKSVVSGAKVHPVKPHLLLNIDLENFFPTITFERVRGMFHSFGYSYYIASLLAMICTDCERMPIEMKDITKYVKASERVLPQGSPASPLITNILCRKMDSRLKGFSNVAEFTYSRYADDMSFSFAKEMDKRGIAQILEYITKIVTEEGFHINPDKTHILKANTRQSITGIVINNDEIGVPKKWVKKLRAAIHQANKVKEVKGIPSHMKNQISGMTCWLKNVNPIRYADIISLGEQILKDNASSISLE